MRAKGNSLIEYALPLTVFLVAGAIVAVLGNIPDRMSKYISATLNGSVEGQSIHVEALGSVPGRMNPPIASSAGELTDLSPVSSLPLMGSGNEIETAGSNGTEQALAFLDQTIAALQAAGDLTPEEKSLLSALSNQGHRIATIQKLIEAEAAAYNSDEGTGETFAKRTITFDGQTKDLQAWADDISYGEMNVEFERLHDEAMGSDILVTNKDARGIVDQAVNKVKDIKRTFEHTVDQAVENDAAVQDLSSQKAGDNTHGESKTVCKTGGGKDSGTKCD